MPHEKLNKVVKYHVCSQAQTSKGMNEQMHLRQNQGYFRGILPDQEQYDPAIWYTQIH